MFHASRFSATTLPQTPNPTNSPLLPNSKPSLNSPPPDSILANVVSRILDIFFSSLLCLSLPLQPINLPLLNFLGLPQALLLVYLRGLHHVHPVDFDEAPRALNGVASKFSARRYEVCIDGLVHEIHPPRRNCQREKYALGRHD